MAVVTEQTGTAAFLLARIGADGAILAVAGYGGAYELIAPDLASTPYIVAQLMSATDIMTANGHRVYSNQLWQIKAVAPATQYAALNTIAIRLDALFGDQRQLSDANMTVSASVREGEVNYGEVIDRRVWKHLGGLYRLQVQLK